MNVRLSLSRPSSPNKPDRSVSVQSVTQVDHGPQSLLAYAIHPGGVLTDMVLRMPPEVQHALTDTPALSADSIAFLTRERWLAGRYISCELRIPSCLSYSVHAGVVFEER